MRRELGCLLTVVWFCVVAGYLPPLLAQSSDQSADSGGGSGGAGGGGGSQSYQADMLTGRFTYGVPIKVAPARQGAEPKLALGYNSAGGNGWCGMGWSLDTGYIQRDTRHGVPVRWVSGAAAPQAKYDDGKGFIANFGGAQSTLVRVGSTNQNPIVYRQEVDTSFLTYNFYTNNHWEVVDKSGNTFYFGEGQTNRMFNPKDSWTAGAASSTFRWALDRVVDVNGNATYLRYTTISNSLYLTNILYNGNVNSPTLAATHEVDFILTNRLDTNSTFISGYRVQSQKLLREIQVKVSGANVRRYVLAYTQSSSTKRSLLNAVTEYGADYTTALPPLTFAYQSQSFAFGDSTVWPVYSQGKPNDGAWNAIRATDVNGDNYVMLADIDGDGLPDRVMRKSDAPYTNYFAVQRNTGSGFAPATTDYSWGPLINPDGQAGTEVNSPTESSANGVQVNADLIDINGDGYVDRVTHKYLNAPYDSWYVQLNKGIQGTSGFSNSVTWAVTTEAGSSYSGWNAIRTQLSDKNVGIQDINGDGLPDRIMSQNAGQPDRFKVQLNTGNGFASELKDWAGVNCQEDNTLGWNGISSKDGTGNWREIFLDINGDGLPDRVMRRFNTPYTNFVVQFNNGAGFEPEEQWGGLDSQNQPGADWTSPIGTGGSQTWCNLIDMNGDGLPDRVMRSYSSPYCSWEIQLNTGAGFAPAQTWGDIEGQLTDCSQPEWYSLSYTIIGTPSYTVVDLVDINGDGLPDRVMRVKTATAPYTNWVVQLNQGPFPDLMSGINNGIGGTVQVSYVASTTLDNRNTNWVNDPWTAGTKSLLPFNVWVVSQITANDGMGGLSTNTYAFKGGYYNAPEREFRGFSQCTVTDPMGTKSTTYFHQSGGRDNSVLGEYQDQASESKKGIPYRIDIVGNDGATNKVTLNKVEEVRLHTNGWYFPFISQTIVMNYEGLAAYRATAKQFIYDTNTENLVKEIDLGEVTNIVANGQTFSDVGSDSIYTWMTYTNLGRPSVIRITSDSAGNNRLRETQMTYDARGNLTGNQVWLDTAGGFIGTTATAYDAYGNPTNATDAAGISTTTTYDATYQQYPIQQATATFTNQFAYDARSGATLQAIDAKGLVASNAFDVLYRSTGSYISTTAWGAPTLWKTKTSYSLGGISSGVSQNYVHKQVNDAVDTANGFETYTYLDGIGRTVQTRAESETAGQFRVANVCYDLRGNAYFQTLPYFSSGSTFTKISGNNLGTLTKYDPVGRSYQVIPAVNGSFSTGKLTSTNATGGDTGSPVGPVTTAFVDGNNPWASVVTDSEGKIKKSYRDAYGRTVQITEVTAAGNYNTFYIYDLLGNLTNVTDNANNQTTMVYDSLGRKTAMTDPDMGTWTYAYDNAGRMTQQIDARNNKLTFDYSDPLGRLLAKRIYNGANLVGTVSYVYDASDDPNYTVFKGQLYKVTDLQGYQRSSYDVRGRVTKTSRLLSVNAMEYVTQTTYDDADRVQTLTYPGNAARIKYTYDTAGNLTQVRSLAGTGTQEIFYTPGSFNALGQLTGYTDGAGVVTTNIYFANSKRLQRVWVSKGATNLQDLSYSYDTVSDIKSIGDNVYTGSASASISSIAYDDLYRVTSVNSAARGTKTYGYNSIGNVLTNQDFGSGAYSYGARPHAVTSANGINYGYDACGNMTTRGNQTLAYDEQNQLTSVSTTNGTVRFGYDGAGERLWRCGTNGYSVWIGGIYEINNGKVLCHVFSGGKRLATFEPLCGSGWAKVFGEENWFVASTKMESIFNWPFEKGRGQWTMLAGVWTAVLGLCMIAGRRIRLQRYEIKKAFRSSLLWKQAVTFASISAFLWATTPEAHAAPAYGPVFYYYHNDNLGSSNVLTDRLGQMVQHYEYATFGQSSFQDNTSAYQVSNRYTGQIVDEETGLYYYHARYYDPQLGRFVQPDSVVASPHAPQLLNRYSYCGNNPIVHVDPGGHIFFLVAMLIGAAIGAAIGAISAAATGGDIAMGALGGACTGAGAVFGPAGAAIGGTIGGMVTTAISGGNLQQIAISGVVNGLAAGISAGVGQAVASYTGSQVARFLASVVTGAIVGGTASVAMGGNFGTGAEAGAISGAVGYGASRAVEIANNALAKAQAKAQVQEQQDLNANQAQQASEQPMAQSDSQAAPTEEVAPAPNDEPSQQITALSAPQGPRTILIGLWDAGLKGTAELLGAEQYGDNPRFGEIIQQAIGDENVRFSISLDGLEGDTPLEQLTNAFMNPQRGATNWEILKLANAGRLGDAILVRNGGTVVVDNPFRGIGRVD